MVREARSPGERRLVGGVAGVCPSSTGCCSPRTPPPRELRRRRRALLGPRRRRNLSRRRCTARTFWTTLSNCGAGAASFQRTCAVADLEAPRAAPVPWPVNCTSMNRPAHVAGARGGGGRVGRSCAEERRRVTCRARGPLLSDQWHLAPRAAAFMAPVLASLGVLGARGEDVKRGQSRIQRDWRSRRRGSGALELAVRLLRERARRVGDALVLVGVAPCTSTGRRRSSCSARG